MEAPSFVDDNAKEANGSDKQTYTLFFYGTLVHPAILTRMIGRSGQGLVSQPAILTDFALHHVKGEDYPALIPSHESKALIAGSADGTGRLNASAKTAVRGTLVRGLTKKDVERLDAFEGDEYVRTAVMAMSDEQVPPLPIDQSSTGLAVDEVLAALTADRLQAMLSQDLPLQPCHVYRWRAPLQKLEAEPWVFETFMKSGKHTKWWQI
jgi:hypothetical protein